MHATTRSATTFALVALAVLGGTSAASAVQPVSVVVDLTDNTVSLSRDDDTYTGSVTVTNPTDDEISVDLAVPTGCTLTVEPDTVRAGREASVDFTITGCEVVDDSGSTLTLGDDTINVTLDVTEVTPAPLRTIASIFAVCAGVAAAVLFLVWLSFRLGRKGQPDDPRPTWSTHISGLSTSWSADAWATNLTVASTAFVALFGESDSLTALLGDEPESAVSHVLVAGLAATFLVGLSAILIKAISAGDDPTIGAVIVGGAVTLTATLGLIANLAYATWTARPEVQSTIAITCAVLGLIAVWYTVATLGGLLNTVVSSTTPPLTDGAMIASAISVGVSVDPNWNLVVLDRAKALVQATEDEIKPPTFGPDDIRIPERRWSLPGTGRRRTVVL